MRRLASLRIPLPPVPGTDYFVSLNQTLAQGSAAMKAYVVHGRDCPIHIGHADDFLAERKFFGFACWRKFRFSCEFYETCHGTFQKMEVRTAELRSARTAGGGCPHVVSAAVFKLRAEADSYLGCRVCAIMTCRLKFSTMCGSSRTSVGRLANDIWSILSCNFSSA